LVIELVIEITGAGSAAFTVIVNEPVLLTLFESVTLTLIVLVVICSLGAPDTSPVDEFNVKPVGKLLDVIEYENGLTPPVVDAIINGVIT
jgi:hypothetical protein